MSAIILASSSVTRARLLKSAGVKFEISNPNIDEDAIKAQILCGGGAPSCIASKLAVEKALAVSQSMPGFIVGSDQTLELERQLFDKPSTLEIARKHLSMLRGCSHQLHTAAALAENGAIIWSTLETSTLTMRGFSDAFLEAYLARNETRLLSCVGGYELEGEGAQLFDSVEGDYFSILGLPLLPILRALRDFGALAP